MTTILDRFWAKVEKRDDGCWFWTGSKLPAGYGHFAKGLAHRWSYEQFVGPIPEGLTIDHLCVNPSCVNPEHMEPVTASENSRRAVARRYHRTPLTPEQRESWNAIAASLLKPPQDRGWANPPSWIDGLADAARRGVQR